MFTVVLEAMRICLRKTIERTFDWWMTIRRKLQRRRESDDDRSQNNSVCCLVGLKDVACEKCHIVIHGREKNKSTNAAQWGHKSASSDPCHCTPERINDFSGTGLFVSHF